MKRDRDTCKHCDATLRGKRQRESGVCGSCTREKVTK